MSSRPAKSTRTTRTTGPSSEEQPASTPSSSDSTSEPANALGLEPDSWTPPEHDAPADVELGDEYQAPPRELLDWTPERAGAIVRAGGFVLHTADSAAREPEGAELWRATEADVDAIAPPLSRILNRYAPARRLAGVSDEFELAIGVVGYVRENMALRGRVVTAKREREEDTLTRADGAPLAGPTSWPDSA